MTDTITLPSTLVEKDGYLVDTETGEIVSHAELMIEGQGDDTFHVRDMQSADWVLEKVLDVDAGLLANAARRAAVLANLDVQDKALERRRDWLMARFGPELQAFAAGELAGKKAKTLTTTYAKLSFRTTPGRIVVTDMAATVEWAEMVQPDAVKVEKRVLPSLLKLTGDALPPGIDLVPPSETFKVDTGLKKQGGETPC